MTLPALDKTISATDIIDRAVADEARHKTFDPSEVRVSSIGDCRRKVVAKCLGYFDETIGWIYSKGGHVLQAVAFEYIRKLYPGAEEEVTIPTSAPGTWTHPDIFIPSLGLSSQVKSCKRNAVMAYVERGEKLPKEKHVEQVLLEWYFWRKAGFCITETGMKILRNRMRRHLSRRAREQAIWSAVRTHAFMTSGFEGILFEAPLRYELLYVCREDFIETRISIPVEWDEERATALAAEFDHRYQLVTWGEVPPVPKYVPDGDCGMQWFDGGRMMQSICPMHEQCWGHPYQPKNR